MLRCNGRFQPNCFKRLRLHDAFPSGHRFVLNIWEQLKLFISVISMSTSNSPSDTWNELNAVKALYLVQMKVISYRSRGHFENSHLLYVNMAALNKGISLK